MRARRTAGNRRQEHSDIEPPEVRMLRQDNLPGNLSSLNGNRKM